MKWLLALSSAALAAGHGAVISPPPRNGVDRDLTPWNGPVPSKPPAVESKTGWCPVPSASGGVSGQNGQACFWFSNGCAIGCDKCDGFSRGPIPFEGGGAACEAKTAHLPPIAGGWCRKFPSCANNTAKPTVCDPKLRTVNTGVACGAADDWYQYSPWRSPGAAPVFDSCGMAGGHLPPDGGFGGIYVNTSHAKLGDMGTKVLPEYKSGTIWKVGSTVEVTWSIEANHGGGYQYRLCPADRALTEDCFRKTPLAFTGKQGLRWGSGANKTELFFEGTYVTGNASTPKGSAWAVNPIPRNDYHQTGKGFAPHCDEAKGLKCSGMEDGSIAVPDLAIVDSIKIPASLAAGEYVLGWRWDCEESNQIWQSCSDVTISV